VVLTITGRKGGAGKSTVALHLAGALAERGPVAVLDLDPDNLTCTEYADGGRLPFPVYTPRTWAERPADLAHIVIDAPARPTREQLAELAERSDLLVFPTTTDAVSLRVLARTLPDAPAGRYRVLLVRTPPRPSRDADRARRSLEGGQIPTFAATIPEAAAFRHAARLRRLAWDVPGVRGNHIRLAFEELADEVST